MVDIKNLTIEKAHRHLSEGDFSVRELVAACLNVIKEKNKNVNAFLEIYDDLESQISEAQTLLDKKQATILTGIPLAIKDNILVKGKIVSAASKILENHRAVYDATAISKLKKENPIFIGRTNMDEFAMGSSTENSAFGPTKNPLNTDYVPGGSSGGSAASVAMGSVLGALGSETCGSIIQPASFCGCVGLKPTYGRVSRHGLIALGSSLDQIGPLAKTATDAETIFNTIKGEDPLDSTSISDLENVTIPKKLTIGVPKDLLSIDGVEKEILENFEQSIKKLSGLGHKIEEIKLPHASHSLAAYYIIMPAEVSANLARYDGVKYGLHKSGDDLLDDYLKTRTEGFGPEPRRRMVLGNYVLSTGYHDAYYNKANMVRNLVIKDFENVFNKRVDVIAIPTTPTPAFKIGEKTSDPVAMYMSDLLTAPANIAGVPTISVPSGFSQSNNLPLGLQFIASYQREDILFNISKSFLGEQNG